MASKVFRNCRLVNVVSGEIYPADIVTADDKIYAVAGPGEGRGEEILDCTGLFAAPGFIDAHFHPESTFLALPELARILAGRGTTAIFANPHEIANVLGLDGIARLLADSEEAPLHTYVLAPCKVPTAPGLETSAAEFGMGEIEEMMSWPNVVGVGEIDAFKLLKPNPKFAATITVARSRGLKVCGSINGFMGDALNTIVRGGITDDHEATSGEEALAKLRLGCTLFVREGSTERNLADILPFLVRHCRFQDQICFCTDDKHPDDLLREGHIDHNIRKAIALGIEPVLAYRMATFNTARHYGLERRIGALTPGSQADIILLRDLEKVEISAVYFGGRPVVGDAAAVNGDAVGTIPQFGRNTVKVKARLIPADLKVSAPVGEGHVAVRAAEIVPNQIVTKMVTLRLPVAGGEVFCDPAGNINKFILVERHRSSGQITKGFFKGFGLNRGALASSVAHDHHHLVAVGANEADMATALNQIIEWGGGLVAVADGHVLAGLPLPIAGLISDQPAAYVISRLEELNQAAARLGCPLASPFATLSLVSLPVIPEVGFTDQGMIDVLRQQVVEVVIG